MLTDLHFGRVNNSELHNKDCINYLKWFCTNVKADPEIDVIIFLGDWHQHRSSVNGMTLHYSYRGAKMLNSLGLPVYFVTGNHDLFNRNNREIFTTNPFESLSNIVLIHDTPVVLDQNDTVLFPYLFEEEYHTLLPKYAKHKIFMGHFEFKGFVLVGDTKVLEHGPEHTAFSNQLRIFSGHFHKRQDKDNTFYIGNAFPGDFGDANDAKRGMATYEFDSDTLEYIDWPHCPMYIKCNLSDVLDEPTKYLLPDARVKCLVDVPLTFEESNQIRERLVKKYKLRELSLEDTTELTEVLQDTEFSLEGMELESTENIIKAMLGQIKSEKISPAKLITIYEGLV
jgi:DNA repair exonuclease SbcCD nuclease subunit